MNKRNIYKFLKIQLKKINVIKKEKDNALKNLNIIKDSRIDSLKLINFLLRIEDKYKIKISTSDLKTEKKQTLDKISEIIIKKIKKR